MNATKIDTLPELSEAVAFWDALTPDIEWLYTPDGRSAVGMVGNSDGGELWSIFIDRDGMPHTSSATYGAWTTGIEC
ncbi:hypothetical protein SEA_DALLAS_206 [Mycobacterium phage Dallas]|nr:hypothetical protein SEA_DALLAS_206 [Mycobacterium phage Dallas]